MLHPTAEPQQEAASLEPAGHSSVNQPLRGRKAVPGENEMEIVLARGLVRQEHQASSQPCFYCSGLKVSQGSCKWR